MALPVVVPVVAEAAAATGATVAARSLLSSIAAWASRASASSLAAVYQYAKKHPYIASTFAASGLNGVMELAKTDEQAAMAVLEIAKLAGIEVPKSKASAALTSVARAAVGLNSEFQNSSAMEYTAEEANKGLAVDAMVEFLKSEVSRNGPYIIKYHAMMNEFLSMSSTSVVNLVGARF